MGSTPTLSANTNMLKYLKKIRRFFIISYRDLRQKFRINKTVTKFLGYAFKVNKHRLDIITTARCNSMCYDCSQNCRQAPSGDKMSLKQINKFVRESKQLNKKWKMIVISGGESILEPDFFDMLDVILKYKNQFSPKTKIRLLTNGRGKQVQELLNKVPNTVEIVSTNKTSAINPAFISINAAPIDMPEYKNADFRNGCRLIRQCGPGLSRTGFYCCSTASAIDRVMGFNLGLKSINASDQDYRKQLDVLCRYCGNFLYAGYKNKPGYQTSSWKKAFIKYKTTKPKLSEY